MPHASPKTLLLFLLLFFGWSRALGAASLCGMTLTAHRAMSAISATRGSALFLVPDQPRNNGNHHYDQYRADHNRRNILTQPCKHAQIPFSLVSLFPDPRYSVGLRPAHYNSMQKVLPAFPSAPGRRSFHRPGARQAFLLLILTTITLR